MENLTVKDGVSIDSVAGHYYSTGDIIMLNSVTAPDGFLACSGGTITSEEYPALYALLGTYYDPSLSVCKLPNLNQNSWIFPCSTVGNEAAYSNVSASHTHTTVNQTVNSANYTTNSHFHSGFANSNDSNDNHSHGGWSGGVGANNASTVANRSNGSGQGVNLAVAGHSHSWGYAVGFNAENHTHSHTAGFGVGCASSDHLHSTTLSTTSPSGEYVLDDVISMRYYIKW